MHMTAACGYGSVTKSARCTHWSVIMTDYSSGPPRSLQQLIQICPRRPLGHTFSCTRDLPWYQDLSRGRPALPFAAPDRIRTLAVRFFIGTSHGDSSAESNTACARWNLLLSRDSSPVPMHDTMSARGHVWYMCSPRWDPRSHIRYTISSICQ